MDTDQATKDNDVAVFWVCMCVCGAMIHPLAAALFMLLNMCAIGTMVYGKPTSTPSVKKEIENANS